MVSNLKRKRTRRKITKIRDLRKGDIVILDNGHEVWVEDVTVDIGYHDDVAKVYDPNIDQYGLLYDRYEWELVRDYSIEE